jgi:hypothetical protein
MTDTQIGDHAELAAGCCRLTRACSSYRRHQPRAVRRVHRPPPIAADVPGRWIRSGYGTIRSPHRPARVPARTWPAGGRSRRWCGLHRAGGQRGGALLTVHECRRTHSPGWARALQGCASEPRRASLIVIGRCSMGGRRLVRGSADSSGSRSWRQLATTMDPDPADRHPVPQASPGNATSIRAAIAPFRHRRRGAVRWPGWLRPRLAQAPRPRRSRYRA